MHILADSSGLSCGENVTNSQLSLTHLAQLTAYRVYAVDRYIPYILKILIPYGMIKDVS